MKDCRIFVSIYQDGFRRGNSGRLSTRLIIGNFTTSRRQVTGCVCNCAEGQAGERDASRACKPGGPWLARTGDATSVSRRAGFFFFAAFVGDHVSSFHASRSFGFLSIRPSNCSPRGFLRCEAFVLLIIWVLGRIGIRQTNRQIERAMRGVTPALSACRRPRPDRRLAESGKASASPQRKDEDRDAALPAIAAMAPLRRARYIQGGKHLP